MTGEDPIEADASGGTSPARPQPTLPLPSGDDGWVDLGGPTGWQLVRAITLGGARFWLYLFYPAYLLYMVLRDVLQGDSPLRPAFFFLAVIVASLAARVIWVGVAFRPPAFNLSTAEIRKGKRTVPLSEITRARVTPQLAWAQTFVFLRLSTSGRRHFWVPVRSSRTRAIGENSRRMLAAALAKTNIQAAPAKPEKYDPTGKFSSIGVPMNLTREQAIEVVLHESLPGVTVPSEDRGGNPRKS